jgi:hypothetical protein
MPLTVGVPLIVMVFEAQLAVTPVGNPLTDPIPVAPVVVCVIFVKVVFKHKVGVEEAVVTELFVVTVMVPVAFTVPHPPVSGIV